LQRQLFYILLLVTTFRAGCLKAQEQPVFRPADAMALSKGGIALRQAFAGGMHSGQFFLFDVNGDSEEDLVVFDRAGDVVKVFTEAEGQYVYQPDLGQFFPENLENWIFLIDYNCDGRKDLFTYSSFGVRIFLNTSADGEFPEWELTEDPLYTQSGSNSVNLLVNPSDIPAIHDMDGDGDIDILAFNFSSGQTAEVYENRSVDNTGSCGLDYVRTNQRWGGFSECNCGNYQFAPFTCSSPAERVMHIEGKAFLIADINGDGRRDALIGQETCDGLTYLINQGTDEVPVFEKRDIYLADFGPAQGAFFPSTFLGDFDRDGRPDLILSSNHREDLAGLDYSRTTFLQKNNGSEQVPDFAAPTPFLQHEMFDVGENAVPVVYDANGDDRPDLLVAQKGQPDETGNYRAAISLLTNKGNGSFEWTTTDWMGLSQLGLTNLSFQFVDIDKDGRSDLVLKGFGLNAFGLKMFWIRNIRGDFDPNDAISLNLDINATDYPFFYDINGNGKLDLLLGQSNGRLSLWLNSGTNQEPVYTADSKTDAYLGIDRTPDRTFLVPMVANVDSKGGPDLLLADNSGELRVIYDFAATNTPTAVNIQLFNATLNTTQDLRAGRRLWPALADVNGDNSNELIIGTAQGGLLALTASDELGNPGEEVKLQVSVYPNPLETTRTVTISANLDAMATLYNISGQQLNRPISVSRINDRQLSLGHLPSGVYLLRIVSGSQVVIRRIIAGP